MGNQHKVYDADMMFWDAVSTASGFTQAASPVYSATLDLGLAEADKHRPGEIIIHWPGIVGATATLTFALCTKATSPPTTTEMILQTPALTIASIAADDEIRIPLPSKGMLRYVRVAVTIGTADLTAGTIHAGLVK